MLIFLRECNGNGLELELDLNSSINQLHQWLKQKFIENHSKFSLFFKGKLIQPSNESLNALSLKPMDIIHMQWITDKHFSSGLINVNVFYQDEIYSLRISNHDSVIKLKHRICEVTYVHPKSQFLFFRGKKLDENSTLTSQLIQNDSLITLVVVQRKETFQKGESRFDKPERQLLQSISSLKIKRTQSQKTNVSKTSLFRSDSWGVKLNKEYVSPEIQVKYLRNAFGLTNSIDSEAELNRLFNICMQGNSQDIITREVLLGGSCQLGSVKLNQSFRFSNGFEIKEAKEQNDDNAEDWIDEDKILTFKQKAQSLYKKLEFDESSDSIEFENHENMEQKLMYFREPIFKEENQNPELDH